MGTTCRAYGGEKDALIKLEECPHYIIGPIVLLFPVS